MGSVSRQAKRSHVIVPALRAAFKPLAPRPLYRVMSCKCLMFPVIPAK